MSIKSLKVFGLQRIIAFTSDLTLSLKKKSIYDERIAYHSFSQDRRNIKYLPSRKGERYASALTNISLNNKVFKNFGKISLKDYISSFIKGH